jgi:AraC-like DNA-binding protein
MGPLEPWTHTMTLNAASTLTRHCYLDRLSVVRVTTTGALAEPIHKTSSVPAVLVSVFLRPVARGAYRLWVDGAELAVGAIAPGAVTVVDLAAAPAMWGARGVDHVHFHVRRAAIGDGALRLVVGARDGVLAELARRFATADRSPLALDELELTLGAHLAARYGGSTLAPRRGLAAWQQRRALELLAASVGAAGGGVRLAELARACDRSARHFARAFKASFGVTPHRWLTDHRIALARDLLARRELALADVATRTGFADQATFTRAFQRAVGVPPGRWRSAIGKDRPRGAG